MYISDFTHRHVVDCPGPARLNSAAARYSEVAERQADGRMGTGDGGAHGVQKVATENMPFSFRKLIEARNIRGIVIGLPRNMDGSEGPRAQASRAYARNLAEAFALPVLLWDERWSTKSAEDAMIGLDVSRRKRAERIDAEAATVILQGAIDAATGSPLF